MKIKTWLCASALACAGFAATAVPAIASDAVRAAVLRVEHPRPLPISRLDLPPDDLGFAGGRVGTSDNATTGQFLNQVFETDYVSVPPEDAGDAMEALIADGYQFIVTMADAPTLLELADAAQDRALLFNATAPDNELRNVECRANVVHPGLSRGMQADALAQFLVFKRWTRWFLIEGSHPRDTAMADAYRAAAEKFGARIVEARVFEDTGGARRTDSGHVQVQAQLPVFTQRAREHDVVILADESQVFAAHMPYHTWDARPVAGSAGLRPVIWHPAQEAWGGTQLHTRFTRQIGREMREEDYAVWLAMRILGEAATRSGSQDFTTMRDAILGGGLEFAGFKGQAMTLRDWDHQIRQPVVLAADNIVVSVSPQDEFLHQFSPLDTLGTDRPETGCNK
ncbi:MAG: branched-chain amino acid ABC transporter substrate-binding protein [Rhodobacteraceae bacterium]|nr:MAG: branched-chain amino acid ABC transporter substrate-binding protein [Paracoccaceae bacterium]